MTLGWSAQAFRFVHKDSNERPVGPVVVAYNRTLGWNNGHTPET